MFGLFLGAYAPLCIIFGLRTSPKHFWHFETVKSPSSLWFLAALLGVLYLGITVNKGYKVGAARRSFVDIDDQGAQVTGYLATYLLPFITPTAPTVRDYVGYAIFFASAFAIFMRSNMALINPTLYALGYSVYKARWVTATGDRSVLIISRDRLPATTEFNSADLGGIFVAKGDQ